MSNLKEIFATFVVYTQKMAGVHDKIVVDTDIMRKY